MMMKKTTGRASTFTTEKVNQEIRLERQCGYVRARSCMLSKKNFEKTKKRQHGKWAFYSKQMPNSLHSTGTASPSLRLWSILPLPYSFIASLIKFCNKWHNFKDRNKANAKTRRITINTKSCLLRFVGWLLALNDFFICIFIRSFFVAIELISVLLFIVGLWLNLA